MNEQSSTVKRGSRIKAYLKGGARRSIEAETDAQGSRAIAPVETDEPFYVFGADKIIRVFDLGTRLRTVPEQVFDGRRMRTANATDVPSSDASLYAEYVELDMALHPMVRPSGGGLAYELPTTAELLSLNERLLGQHAGDELDPFGYTLHGATNKKLAHCQPVPLWSPAELNAGRNHVHLNTDTHTETLSKKGNTVDKPDKWNPLNVDGGALKAAVYKFKGARAHDFSVVPSDSIPAENGYEPIMYESFDTADEDNFKITIEPDFAAEAAELQVACAVSVYLVPMMYVFFTFAGIIGGVNIYAWTDRLPLYPYPVWPFSEPTAQTVFTFACIAFGRHRDIAGIEHYLTHGLELIGIGTARLVNAQDDELVKPSQPAGALCAVIVCKERRHYVWRRTPDATPYSSENPFVAFMSLPYTGDFIHPQEQA